MPKLEQRFHQLRKIVLGLSGAHEEVLALVPSERARFESLGWAILITSGVAAVSMWFALASAVGINGILALPIALAWGLVIMGIDRWLIVSMPIDGKRKFAIAAPRLALALLLGTLISTPLVLRVFQSEINAQVAKMQQQSYNTFLQQQQASNVARQVSTYTRELQYVNNVIATHGAATSNTASDPQLTAYNKQLTTLNGELTHWTTLKNQYYTDYICQLYGGPTCPKKGNGPAARASLTNYRDASRELDVLKGQANRVQGEIAQRDAQLTSSSKADQQARYQQALTQQPIVKNEYDTALQRQNELQASFFASNRASHGILIRLEALSQLSNGDLTVTAARFLLFLLFLVIECLPVTVKLMQRPGLYEEALQQARESERRDASKFFRFRSRLTGPGGTAVLQPMLTMQPERRIDAIWTPTLALPGSVVVDDDEPTDAMDDPGPPAVPGEVFGYGPAGDDPPEQRWYGSDRWRNHWQDRYADEDEPPATRRDARPGDSDTDAGGLRTQPHHTTAYGGEGPRDGGGPYGTDGPYGTERLYDTEGLYDTGDPRDARHAGGGREAARDDHDEQAGGAPDGQAPASAMSPGAGGTPLSWDEDE